jgi:hypothetical protein
VCPRRSRVTVTPGKGTSGYPVSRTPGKEQNVRSPEPTISLQDNEETGRPIRTELRRVPKVMNK